METLETKRSVAETSYKQKSSVELSTNKKSQIDDPMMK